MDIPRSAEFRTDCRTGCFWFISQGQEWRFIVEAAVLPPGQYNWNRGNSNERIASARVVSISGSSITVAFNTNPDCVEVNDATDPEAVQFAHGLLCGIGTFTTPSIFLRPHACDATIPGGCLDDIPATNNDLEMGDLVKLIAPPPTIEQKSGQLTRIIGLQ